MYRVLVLTSTYPRWDCDTEPRFVLDLCRYMAESAEIFVIAPHAPGASVDGELEGVPVHRFRYFFTKWQGLAYQGGLMARLREKPWRAIQVPFFLCAEYLSAVRAIRAFEPHVVHAHWLLPQGLIACLATRGRLPVLCTSHGGDLFGLQGKLLGWLKSWVVRRCCAVAVVSDAMVSRVRDLSAAAKIEVIPMGTDVNSMFTPPAGGDARSDNELLFVGRLVHGKGVDKLLEALSLMQGRHVRLTLAGDGPLRTELLAQARRLSLSDRVTFLGSVSHERLVELYRRATIAVFPFVSEQGFGLVLTEAMACGCPVIASELGAVRQSVQHEATGILTQPGDSKELAEAIQRCLDDKEGRSRMARAALESVQQHFAWRPVANRYLQLIESCLSAGGNRCKESAGPRK